MFPFEILNIHQLPRLPRFLPLRPSVRNHPSHQQHYNSQCTTNSPEQPLTLIHISNVACAHPQIARCKGKWEEDNGNDSEDKDGDILTLGFDVS